MDMGNFSKHEHVYRPPQNKWVAAQPRVSDSGLCKQDGQVVHTLEMVAWGRTERSFSKYARPVHSVRQSSSNQTNNVCVRIGVGWIVQSIQQSS